MDDRLSEDEIYLTEVLVEQSLQVESSVTRSQIAPADLTLLVLVEVPL